MFQPVIDGKDDQIQRGIWDSSYDDFLSDIEQIKKVITEFRKNHKFIKTVWGVGYKIEK